ncbi:FAD binding domain-containing protein [bacterium]|nr:FAD binding domain-containing protein [bacterium]
MIPAFTYKNPQTVPEAVALLAPTWGEAEVLAGGSDLLAAMKDQLVAPKTVVNIKGLKDLSTSNIVGGKLVLGANVTLAELAELAPVNKHFPALAKAAKDLGSIQIRNVATLGGNLCQRNRDWYYRNQLGPEVKENLAYGAIFPADGQSYVHPSTLAPVLIALSATAQVVGPNGAKDVPIEKLFQVSDLKNKREVTLAPNEIITNVTIPITEAKSAEIQVRERQSHDWPLVQAAVALLVDNTGMVQKANIILGHVGPVPRRATDAEKFLVGKKLDESLATEAGKQGAEGAQPHATNEYKVQLVRVAIKRALLSAMGNDYWRGTP